MFSSKYVLSRDLPCCRVGQVAKDALIVLLSGALVMATITTAHSTGGYEGTFEYALDAPWRMEPHVLADGKIEYGAIPIQITIHDAMFAGLDPGVSIFDALDDPRRLDIDLVGLGNICEIAVGEFQERRDGVQKTVTHFSLEDLAEIEMTVGAWPWPVSAFGLGDLAFGDFNGDGKTDVFHTSDGKWGVSYGGSGKWQKLNESSVELGDLAFGDFNGDGKTDVFHAADGKWGVSYGGSGRWQKLNDSKVELRDLAFGDFDGDGKTDVFHVNVEQRELDLANVGGEAMARFYAADGKWNVSYGGRGKWQKLNEFEMPPQIPPFRFISQLMRWSGRAAGSFATDNLEPGGLAFGDFDGDGKTDVLHDTMVHASGMKYPGRWQVSYGGTDRWQYLPEAAPQHRICRVWDGDDCEPFRNVSGTSEWHGLLWYQPKQEPKPGSKLSLEIEVRVTHVPWVDCNGVVSGKHDATELVTRLITLKSHVEVYFGDAPLPRFNNSWLYGDLHYHSQGTDNEGESAYNYRGVVRAMGAMGLDFVFATEHASDAAQLIDADLDLNEALAATSYVLGKTPLSPGGGGPALYEQTTHWGVLRDMSKQRFTFNHELIYGKRGVNREAALLASDGHRPQGYLTHHVVPQVFLGGELDAIPEIRAIDNATVPIFLGWSRDATLVTYGNGRKYDISELCGGWNSDLAWMGRSCEPEFLVENVNGAFLVKDVQGIDGYDYGREHLVYFPRTGQLMIPKDGQAEGRRETAFIASDTGRFGGANRRLTEKNKGMESLLPEIEKKGYVFIAHHLNGSKGSPGPEGPPWSEHMLRQAWASPAVLGLEFWNEDGRVRSTICRRYQFEECEGDEGGYEIGYERNETFEVGPKTVSTDPAPVNERRQGFVDTAQLFELIPWNLETGAWGERTWSIESTLHHGSYSWDHMNLLGLDENMTRQLEWLEPGEPRRFFMAGGSDAHGDLNYRRAGYFLRTTETNETALGKPRNLVLVGRPMVAGFGIPGVDRGGSDSQPGVSPGSVRALETPRGETKKEAQHMFHTQEQVTDALHQGRFCVTDGPALRIAVDVNGNGEIDHEDVQMGGIAHLYRDEPLNLLVEWLSTPEFGPVTKVDLYVGVAKGVDEGARTYAPRAHGTRSEQDPKSTLTGHSYESNGRTYQKMEDGYWLDSALRIVPPRMDPELPAVDPSSAPPNSLAGVSLKVLNLDNFEVENRITGDRFFIRAFAETNNEEMVYGRPTGRLPAVDVGVKPWTAPIPRYAFTNPIWIIRQDRYEPKKTPGVNPRTDRGE